MSRNNRTRAWSCLVIAGFAVAGRGTAALADTNEGPFTFTNNTGMGATSLEVIFSGTGGSLHDPTVTAQPPNDNTGVPAIFSSGSGVSVKWTGVGVKATQSTDIKVMSAFPGITPALVTWKQFGNTVSGTGPVWPVALAPSVTGNFGTDEVPSMHSALDIDAPVDTPVRAAVDSILVGFDGNYVIASDGTNLWAYAHVKKTVGAHGNDFAAGDIGTVLKRGQNFGFVIGSANTGGGSFDHVHLEYMPGEGTAAKIQVDPADLAKGYKAASVITPVSDLGRVNPLLLYDVKDPGGRAPTIGPIFFRPMGANVGGYKEFGMQQTAPGVRKGTFINGQVTSIEQIYDNQGSGAGLGIQPVGGSTTNDPIDATIKLDNIIASDPYQVSYKVQGKGPVAAFGIPERTLVTFNQTDAVLSPKITTIYDSPKRDVKPPAPNPPYNHSFNLTSTDGTKPDSTHLWNTIAPKTAGADGVDAGGGFSAAANNAKGLFPDGVYQVNGYGFDIGADGSPANKTSIDYMVRLNNWKQTAVATKGGPTAANPVRADDVFAPDGAETTTPAAGVTFNAGIHENIFGVGDNYLPNTTYTWDILPDQATWTQGDAYNWLLRGTFTSDADGHIPDTVLTDSAALSNKTYDLAIDYDNDGSFSWTLDGISRFAVIPEPSNGLAAVVAAAVLCGRRRRNC